MMTAAKIGAETYAGREIPEGFAYDFRQECWVNKDKRALITAEAVEGGRPFPVGGGEEWEVVSVGNLPLGVIGQLIGIYEPE